MLILAWTQWIAENITGEWGGYHQELSSQLITLKSQIFPFKNSNLQSYGLGGLVTKSSVLQTRQVWNLLSSHLRFWVSFNLLSFWVSFNLLSSQGLIFRLPKNPVTPQKMIIVFQMVAHTGVKPCDFPIQVQCSTTELYSPLFRSPKNTQVIREKFIPWISREDNNIANFYAL